MNQQTFGKYQLLKKLATGGMAEVFLARKTGIEGFEKLCVVKRILPHLADDPEFVQMFLNEAKIAARFNHPNIAQIDELGEVGGNFFIAMEFVRGEDLGRVMRKAWSSGQWVARPLAIRIVASCCEGLYYAHTKTDDRGTPLKVVHRDISPQNILISFDGSVKLVDFGIAKAADAQSMTKSGAIKGKFAYMSPEQAAGKPLDHRSDIFAIGLVLYELLTGVRPLKRDSELATLQAALECDIEAPSKVADVPAELDPIVMNALAKSADDRYRDARQFQMALEEFLVSQRWVATSVQVEELMRALFAERIEEEDRLGYPNPSIDDGSNVSGSPAAPEPPKAKAPRPAPEATSASDMQWDAPPATQAPPRRESAQRGSGGRGLAKSYRSSDQNKPAASPAPANVADWEAPPATEIPGARRMTGETRSADVVRRSSSDKLTSVGRASRVDVPSAVPRADLDEDAPPPRRTRTQNPPRTASRTGNVALKRRTGEFPEVSDDDRSDVGPAPRPKKSGQFSLDVPKRLPSAKEMPEAPPPALATDDDDDREVSAKKKRKANDDLGKVVDPHARARNVKAAALAAFVLVTAGAGFVFREQLQTVLTSTANDGAEIFVNVDSNMQVELFVEHHPDEGRLPEPVYLGKNPLKKVGGVHVRDTIVFENRARGLRYRETIPFGQPGETRAIRKDFQTGHFRLHLEPKSLKGLQLYLHGQEVGSYPGPKLELVEGKHALEIRGTQLKQPAQIEIEVKPGVTSDSKVFNLASLMLE